MASQVFYRKWRPQTFSEVVGQEPITRTLLNAVATGRVAHAYLFFGPRGTGKTSTGRILAKAVNCLQNETGEPCNRCAMCLSFNEGTAMDLIEIDAASNRGIDEIRDLREKVNFAPNIARYKVYIIDEVHMLTEPAFNALLKTLEEPPSHVIFVLATTEVHKVPATIISRCQRFDFHRIPQSAVIKRLEQICQAEGIKADPEALALIAKSATGSLRDAENLLEQMLIYHGPRIELQQVKEELGLSGDLRIKELVRFLFNKDISAGLAVINSASNDGLDLRRFNRELVEYLRGMLLVKAGAEETLSLTPDELAEMRNLGAGVSLEDISRAIKLFSQADFRFSPQSTLPLELALVDYVLVKPEERQKEKISLPEEVAVAKTPSPKEEKGSISPVGSGEAKESPPSQPPELEYIRQHWNDFVNACRGEGSRGNLDALLRRSCKPISLEGETLVLGFYAEFQKSKIEDPKYRRMVERKLKEVFGVPYQVKCVLLPREKKTKPQPATENPLVKAALDMGARIISEE